MANQRTVLQLTREVFILVVVVLGLVLSVVGLIIHDLGVTVVGVIFVVACVMGEGLSHFAVGSGRLTMKSRAKPTGRRAP